MGSRWDIRKAMEEGPKPRTIVSPHDSAEMVLIPQGPFTMGINEEEVRQIFTLDQRENPVFVTEMPARTVYLTPYYIDRYPVTN